MKLITEDLPVVNMQHCVVALGMAVPLIKWVFISCQCHCSKDDPSSPGKVFGNWDLRREEM